MVALLCFFSVFFHRKVSSSYFLLPIFKKTVKPKCKTTFSEVLKGYICINFCYQAFKIKRSSKIFTFQKIKDFIGYGGLHMLYKPINRP